MQKTLTMLLVRVSFIYGYGVPASFFLLLDACVPDRDQNELQERPLIPRPAQPSMLLQKLIDSARSAIQSEKQHRVPAPLHPAAVPASEVRLHSLPQART